MHGGTNPGAPRGNQNALKHGHYTAHARGLRRFARQMRQLLRGIDR